MFLVPTQRGGRGLKNAMAGSNAVGIKVFVRPWVQKPQPQEKRKIKARARELRINRVC